MVYDNEARKLVVKAIATVESNIKFDSVNYNDPITVGVMQWYGTRAAELLSTIRGDNPASWTGVTSRVENALDTRPTNSSWWTGFYLNRADGESLRPVLLANQTIQLDIAYADMDKYRDVAVDAGMDSDGNTDTMLFFMCMYHQSPRQAMRVLSAAGVDATLQRIYTVCLNNDVLSRYRTRYTTCRDIIASHDSSGIDGPVTPSPPPEDGGDDETAGVERLRGDILYIERNGDELIIRLKNGALICSETVPGKYIPTQNGNIGADVPAPPPVVPEVPPSADVVAKRQALVDFMNSKIGVYSYSQGPQRMKPDVSGYTDCSALVWYAYKTVLNIELGTYTGSQYTQGDLVTQGSGNINESLLKPGDLIFYNWPGGRSTVDHVEMYRGNGEVIGHGGNPNMGPVVKNSQTTANRALNWIVRRHVK